MLRQSVTTLCEFFRNDSDDFNHFLHAVSFYGQNRWYKILFWYENYKGVFQEGVSGGHLRITIIFYLLKDFFKNLELGLLLSLQGDSIGSNPKFHKGSLFFLWRRYLNQLILLIFKTRFQQNLVIKNVLRFGVPPQLHVNDIISYAEKVVSLNVFFL